MSHYLLLFKQAKTSCPGNKWILKNKGLVLLYKTLFGIETVSCCLLPWIAWMHMEWDLKNWPKKYNAMPEKNDLENFYGGALGWNLFDIFFITLQ